MRLFLGAWVVLQCVHLPVYSLGGPWLSFTTRDTPSPALQMLTIPLSYHTDGSRYSVDVTMSPNSAQPQHFKFALSTSTGYIYVAGPRCSTCGGASSRYNQSASNSVGPGPSQETQNVTVLNQQVHGTTIKEDCVLKTTSGSGWNYSNQTIVVADSSTFANTSGIDGLIGMGTLSGESFQDTLAGQWLNKNSSRTNFTYGMSLNRPYGNETILDGGLLHWFTPDHSAYQGEPVYQTIEPRTPAAASSNNQAVNSVSSGDNHTLNADWVINVDAYSFTGAAGSFSQNSSQSATAPMKAILDPYYPDIYFPQLYSKLVYATVPGASAKSSGSATNIYNLPCDQKMSLSVTFGRFTISLTEAHLVKKQSDGTCVGTIQEWSDQAVPEFLFGSAFISNVYLIFVITEEQSQIGFAARSTPSSASGLSKGAIAGIAIGSAVGASLIVGIILYILLRRRNRWVRPKPRTRSGSPLDEGQEVTIKQNTSIDPYPITPPLTSSRPLLSGNESRTSPSATPPATPQSPEWRHLSYATYQPNGTEASSTLMGRLETIPDSPPPYLHGGTPWLQEPSSLPRKLQPERNGASAAPQPSSVPEHTIA